jgi:UDP-N-acetylglucosamine 2-epimerase (non-hydrolysing)
MKISVIFGTRPEAIKLAPVIIELKKDPDIECKVCVTAQHREMLDQVLEVFNITPDADLNLMVQNQSLAELTASAINQIDKYLKSENPDAVIIQGDTTTVLSVALVAFYNKIPVCHVEAGLRTGDMYSPFPEETNRVLISRLAHLHFAPSVRNKSNLIHEGIEEVNVTITGNTVIDSLNIAKQAIINSPPFDTKLSEEIISLVNNKKFILVTGHRRENIGEGISNLCHALIELSNRFPDVHFVYPVHLNPNVMEPVHLILGSYISSKGGSNIHLIPPQDYLTFVYLLYNCFLVLTDSGGIQEEAPSFGKPVLVFRETTERPEGVQLGVSKVIGVEKESIIREVSNLLLDQNAYKRMSLGKNPYGDGMASKRVVDKVKAVFKKG